MSRRDVILQVLADHPGGLACENLLAAVVRQPADRQLTLLKLRRLAAAGLVVITGKRQSSEIAGALVTISERHEARSTDPGRSAIYRRVSIRAPKTEMLAP